MEGKYINLVTFKKDGNPIETPIWFVEKDGKLYVSTKQTRYKIKRINNNSNVKIAPCSFFGKIKGAYINGTARVLPDGTYKDIENLLLKKYFLARFMGIGKEKKGDKRQRIIEIMID
ncbi:MAG: PPOX class F420-dependent oxidoreductase [Promethearchaeota archaeon]